MSLREKIHNRKGIFSMVAQVFLDQCLHHPLMYFPAFYFVKTLVQGGTTSDAFSLYKSNIKEDMLALWKVWVPATIVNFTFSYVASYSLRRHHQFALDLHSQRQTRRLEETG
jgi:hypothetical protein